MGTGQQCHRCGTPNAEQANFCSVCGAALRSSGEHTATHPAIHIDGSGPLTLVVVRGSNLGSQVTLDSEETTIGRHPESTMFLDDVTVSRRHAEIRRSGDKLVLSDVGSLNGTYVNGTRVESHVIAEGDQIQVGKYRLVVALGATDGDQ